MPQNYCAEVQIKQNFECHNARTLRGRTIRGTYTTALAIFIAKTATNRKTVQKSLWKFVVNNIQTGEG